MCHNHRTLFTCGHNHDLVTLCSDCVAPFVWRATHFPYTSAVPNPSANPIHDVILTAAASHILCVDCENKQRLPELDIFNLGGSPANIKPLDEGLSSTTVKVDAPLDLARTRGEVGVTAQSRPLMSQSASSLTQSRNPPYNHALASCSDTATTNHKSTTSNRWLKHSKACKLNVDTFIPYTGGLGLLVNARLRKDGEQTEQKRQPTTLHNAELANRRIMAKL